MFDTLLKGFAMGFAIAVPVGPIGLLCIRRSLRDGRAAGLATGLGAATADGTYGLLVALGVSATGMLIHYAPQMQLIGGTLIVLIGLLTLRSFFQPRPEAAPLPAGSLPGTFASTYLLTLSNPMTILLFTGMIAGLGAAAGGSTGSALTLVLGVFLGSAAWWLILVQLSLWAGKALRASALRWLDLLAGSVLCYWGLNLALAALASPISP